MSRSQPSHSEPPGEADLADDLVRGLTRACRGLAQAGRPRDAALIAADAWVLLRRSRPELALRLDGTMHHIARLEQQLEAANPPRSEPSA